MKTGHHYLRNSSKSALKTSQTELHFRLKKQYEKCKTAANPENVCSVPSLSKPGAPGFGMSGANTGCHRQGILPPPQQQVQCQRHLLQDWTDGTVSAGRVWVARERSHLLPLRRLFSNLPRLQGSSSPCRDVTPSSQASPTPSARRLTLRPAGKKRLITATFLFIKERRGKRV